MGFVCVSVCVFLWFLLGDRSISRLCHPSERGSKKQLIHSQLKVVVLAFTQCLL